jgi:hypothetical protein
MDVNRIPCFTGAAGALYVNVPGKETILKTVQNVKNIHALNLKLFTSYGVLEGIIKSFLICLV